jgi:hypothetical protein
MLGFFSLCSLIIVSIEETVNHSKRVENGFLPAILAVWWHCWKSFELELEHSVVLLFLANSTARHLFGLLLALGIAVE